MNPFYKSLALATFLLVVSSLDSSVAQTELTAQNSVVPMLGNDVTIMQYEADAPETLSAIVTVTGENVTWDLTGTTFGEPSSLTQKSVALPADGIPGQIVFDQYTDPAPNFANIARGIFSEDLADSVDLYFVFYADESRLVNYGFSTLIDATDDGIPDEVVIAYDPPEVQFNYPTVFGSEWTTDVTQNFIVLDGFQFDANVVKTNKVVGWGTLDTPMGSADVLQIEKVMNITTFGFTTTTKSLEFIGPFQDTAGKSAQVSVSAEVSLSADGTTATSMSYSAIEAGGGGNPTAQERIDDVPATFEIHANYPNPFNPSTTLQYSVAHSGHVLMTIHDLHGRLVDTVVDEVVSAGTYATTWDASNLSSGMYQVRVSMDGEVRARSLVLQK